MQNNDLIGKLVLSEAGRDKGNLYVIINRLDDSYYELSNGKNINRYKKKNLKHFRILENADLEIREAIMSKNKSTDLLIKRFLKIKGIVKEG